MKRTLHFAILWIFIFATVNSTAQVTRLYQNNNIQYGAPLGTTGVLVDLSGALWKTDGTPGGTMQYTSKVKVDTNQLGFTLLNNKIYFAGVESTNGTELWVTDGTDAGTKLVKDIETGSSSSTPQSLVVFNNEIYFYAATTTSGNELWKSDGTSGGTAMVKDINPGAGDSYDSYIYAFASLGKIVFSANDGTNGNELWMSDGTSGGTSMVKDINNGAASSSCNGFTQLGSLIIFSADDGGSKGAQAFRTDLSSAGTFALTNVSGPPFIGPAPSQFTLLLGKVYFTIFSGNTAKTQLWVTDGSTAGTSLVKDFGSGAFPLIISSVIFGNKFYFSALTSAGDQELWNSDGTTAGTQIFYDINVTGSSNAFLLPDYFGAGYNGDDFHTRLWNGKIFFFADDGTNGNELWITDGTVAGTSMVKDVNPGANPSITSNFSSWFYTVSGLFYTADDGTNGNELWKSDGTAGGTAMVDDVNPGSNSSDPYIFLFVNNHIYFTADDNSDGMTDLYIVDESVTLPLTLLNFTATLNGKAAQLQWTTVTEINTKNFIVQRSTDGIHFTNIGTVNAAGNSTQKITYQFSDNNALNVGSNKVYYRLQMVDNDGRFKHSNIAMITITPSGKLFVVYPNPVKDKLTIKSSVSLNKTEVRITDVSGKVVQKQQLESVQAGVENTINVASLNKGVYYLQFVTGSDVQTVKFFKY